MSSFANSHQLLSVNACESNATGMSNEFEDGQLPTIAPSHAQIVLLDTKPTLSPIHRGLSRLASPTSAGWLRPLRFAGSSRNPPTRLPKC